MRSQTFKRHCAPVDADRLSNFIDDPLRWAMLTTVTLVYISKQFRYGLLDHHPGDLSVVSDRFESNSVLGEGLLLQSRRRSRIRPM